MCQWKCRRGRGRGVVGVGVKESARGGDTQRERRLGVERSERLSRLPKVPYLPPKFPSLFAAQPRIEHSASALTTAAPERSPTKSSRILIVAVQQQLPVACGMHSGQRATVNKEMGEVEAAKAKKLGTCLSSNFSGITQPSIRAFLSLC